MYYKVEVRTFGGLSFSKEFHKEIIGKEKFLFIFTNNKYEDIQNTFLRALDYSQKEFNKNKWADVCLYEIIFDDDFMYKIIKWWNGENQ